MATSAMLPFLLAALLVLVPSVARATPQAWFVWDRDASLDPGASNRDFTGPTTIRAAVVARGLSGPIRGHQVILKLFSRETSYPDALRFDDAGCQAGRAVLRPGPEGGQPHSLRSVDSRILTGTDWRAADPSLWVGFAAVTDGPGVIAHPDSEYVLAEIDLDLANAIAGPSSDGRCGCANQKAAIQWSTVAYLDGAGVVQTVGVYPYECIGWNDARHDYCYGNDCFVGPPCVPNPIHPSTCDAPTPVTTASWGRVKASYR